MLTLDKKNEVSTELLNFWLSAGMPSEIIEKKRLEKPFNFSDYVDKIPLGYRRMVEEEQLFINNKNQAFLLNPLAIQIRKPLKI